MKTYSLDEFAENMAKIMDEVVNTNESVKIKGSNKRNAVLISEAEFNSMQETQYLLATKANRKALKESLAQLNAHNKI